MSTGRPAHPGLTWRRRFGIPERMRLPSGGASAIGPVVPNPPVVQGVTDINDLAAYYRKIIRR